MGGVSARVHAMFLMDSHMPGHSWKMVLLLGKEHFRDIKSGIQTGLVQGNRPISERKIHKLHTFLKIRTFLL